MELQSIDVDSVSINGEVAKVVLSVVYRLAASPVGEGAGSFGDIEKVVVESWVYRDGSWWYFED